MSDLHCNTNRPDHKPAVMELVITVIKQYYIVIIYPSL